MTTKTNSRSTSIGWRELIVTWALAAGALAALALASERGPSDIVGLLNCISPAAGQVMEPAPVQSFPVVHNDEGGFDVCSARDYADERC